jgi:hypothetical protein
MAPSYKQDLLLLNWNSWPSCLVPSNSGQRNSAHLTDYFKLPVDAVVEIGREISI